MFHSFEGQTANELWGKIVEAFRYEGRLQNSRAGGTREILLAGLALQDPRQRWISDRQPPINLAFAFAEIIWIIRGRQDAAFLNYFNRKLPLFSGDTPIYPGAYGYRLRRHFGFDQLERAYDVLKHNPDSRQVVLQIWDAKADLPSSDGSPASADVPCNVLSLLKVREGRLEWTQVMRSNDLFRGLPYNIAQFTCLQEILAGWLEIQLGAYHHLSDSLHVYDENWPDIATAPSNVFTEQKISFNPDSLALAKFDSERTFALMEHCVEEIVREQIPVQNLPDLVRSSGVPMPYQNILSIVAAESSRRRHSPEVTSELIGICSNTLYQSMFRLWLERLRPV